MFLPNNNAQAEKDAQRECFNRIEGWCIDKIPENLRSEAVVTVQEVQCGDPQCAPIDTLITILFNRYVLKAIGDFYAQIFFKSHSSFLPQYCV